MNDQDMRRREGRTKKLVTSSHKSLQNAARMTCTMHLLKVMHLPAGRGTISSNWQLVALREGRVAIIAATNTARI